MARSTLWWKDGQLYGEEVLTLWTKSLKGEAIPFPTPLQTCISETLLYLRAQIELDAHTLPFDSTHEYFKS